MTENETLLSALKKVKEQKENFGFMDRFNVDENWEVMKALEEIQQYRAIGTIEEFKALKEKNTPKKVAYQGEHEKCPSCGSFHVFGKHCTECGQAVDYD